ncbi:MAG: ADP-ribosylglycohydrolase family protein [Mogibacterium sp.]|nr:ADP-ribosylglycohydrolase family protein [Mogibacterium sp.]
MKQDKIRGCLVGGAAGDALGYAVEFTPWNQIEIAYGPGGIQEYELDSFSRKAIISDDTQMTLFTANGILIGDTRGKLTGHQAYPRFYVYYSYLDWYMTQSSLAEDPSEEVRSWLLDVRELHKRRAPGTTCLQALRSGKCGSTEEPINNSKGCGGVMRVAPLGLRYPSLPYATLDREGAELAAITHGHPLGYLPAAMLVHIIRDTAYSDGSKSLKSIVLEAYNTVLTVFGPSKPMDVLRDLIQRAIVYSTNDRSDLENIKDLGEGWVGEETLAISVYCALRYQNDFSKGIIAAVNHDGDSDSTGAVTGNILGAWIGYSGIEQKWKDDLEILPVILEIADDLATACPLTADDPKKDPVWVAKYVEGRQVLRK